MRPPFKLDVLPLAAIFLVVLGACSVQARPPADGPLTAAPEATGTPLPNDTAIADSTLAGPTTPAATVPPAAAGIPQLNDPAIQKQVDQLAQWFLEQGRNPGLGISVVRRDPQTGKVSAMLLDYGTLGRGESQPVTPGTVYEIGSITKVFTGILLAEHVLAGRARLDDPIQDYLPAGIRAPSYGATPITLDDLATHRSGLPRDINTDTIAEMYAWLNGFTLSRKPGAEYVYSNVGFSLLGDIVARISGTDFNTAEYEAVSQPLGMTDTREALDAGQIDRLAQGYTYDGTPAQDFPDTGAMSGAGYLRSTLEDMTRFLIANMQPDSTPLGEALNMAQSLQAAGRNPGTGTGLGWEIDQLGTTHERLYKGGGTYGFTSYISFTRDRRAGFVLLTNGMYGETLAPHLLKILGMGP